MRFKGLLELIAGHTAIFAILLLVLLLSIVGAPLLQQKKVAAIRMGADIAITKAYAISEALLNGTDQGVSADANTRSFISRHYKAALIGGTVPPAHMLKPGTIEALLDNPQRPSIFFPSVYGVPHLIYVVHDRHEGVLVLDLPLERERACASDRRFTSPRARAE